MATRRPSSTAKRERSIPIKVKLDTRPAPTSLTPLPADVLRPAIPVPKKLKRELPHPIKTLKQPVHEWSEAKRRKIMWSLVVGGAIVIGLGWISVIRVETNGNSSGCTLFSQTAKLLSSIHWPGTATPKTKAEQEIQQYNNQVFPQFSQ